jgi:hypothetical protein
MDGVREEDDTSWTIDALYRGRMQDNQIPNRLATLRLLRQLHSFWFDGGITILNVSSLLYSKLGFVATDDLNWNVIDKRWKREVFRIKKLQRSIKSFNFGPTQLNDAEEKMNKHLTRAIFFFKRFISESARTARYFDPYNLNRTSMVISDELQQEIESFENEEGSCENKFTPFQKVFMHVRDRLCLFGYKKVQGMLFRKVKTKSGYHTQAFVEEESIQDFILKQCSYIDELTQWSLLTKNGAYGVKSLVEYMSMAELVEAPSLVEDRHLRSFEGDKLGRGAVIYNSYQDFAWPYALRSEWGIIAEKVNSCRRNLFGEGKFVPVSPPDEDNVCLQHINAEFHYDTLGEILDIDTMDHPGLCWREASKRECLYDNNMKEIENVYLTRMLVSKFEPGKVEEERWGRFWQVLEGEISDELNVLVCSDDSLEDKILEGPLSDDDALTWFGRAVEKNDCLLFPSGAKFIPLRFPARRQRVLLTKEEDETIGFHASPFHYVRWRDWIGSTWRKVEPRPSGPEIVDPCLFSMLESGRLHFDFQDDIPPASPFFYLTVDCNVYVVPHDGYVGPVYSPLPKGKDKFFKVHCGMTWMDCDAEEIDHIYKCQDFTFDDVFFCYAGKGRMLFELGELEQHQFTLFFEGVGGCGKSTIMRAVQSLFPPHRRGILSANVETLFGMSKVLNDGRSLAIFCNEVSDELKVNQEEWQTSCSGEEGSYARKNKDPLVIVCKAHHFWVGNSFPTHFKNLSGQVSRRLMGVLMPHPVSPRDGGILSLIAEKVSQLQRKMVLAYFEFVKQTKKIDPLSVPAKLPPAFKAYYESGKRRTDPVLDFLSEGNYVRVVEEGEMLLSDFRELYSKYRMKYCLSKVRWCEEHYRNAFMENRIAPRLFFEYKAPDGCTYNNVTVLRGVEGVE